MKINKVKKSLSFILPRLELTQSWLLNAGFKNCYCGIDPDKDWGENFYLEFKDISEENKNILQRHEYFSKFIELDGSTFVEMKFDEDFNTYVYRPFLNGQYSKIDRNYVDKYFKKQSYDFSQQRWVESVNYSILTKDQRWRTYWEELLDVKLPKDAEIWSRPEKDEEIYEQKDVFKSLY